MLATLIELFDLYYRRTGDKFYEDMKKLTEKKIKKDMSKAIKEQL